MNESEASIFDLRMQYWRERRHPFTGGIEITTACNFDCIHCYLRDSHRSPALTTEDLKLLIDKIYARGTLFLYFTGGEIFTRSDFLEIYTYAKKKGFVVELLTNGSLLSDEILETLDAYPPANISISVYGSSEASYQMITRRSGMFAKVMRSLHLLKEHDLHFDIKFIGLKENIDDFFRVKEIADKLGCGFSHTFEMFPTFGTGDENMSHMLTVEEIIEFEKKYPATVGTWACVAENSRPERGAGDAPLFLCDIALTNFLVDAEGFLNPCNKLRTHEHNLLTCEFDDAWDDFLKYRKMKAGPSFPCVSCRYIGICNPCIAENLLFTGKEEQPGQMTCALAKARYREFSGPEYDPVRKQVAEETTHNN